MKYRPFRRLVVALLLLASAFPTATSLAWHRLPPGPQGLQHQGQRAIRGITVGPIESVQQPQRGYGTEVSEELLDRLQQLGANWVAITPFGRVWSLTSRNIRMDFEAPYQDNRAAVRRMVSQAHARGLRVVLVPHLWVESGGWRGEMAPASWTEYQQQYHAFVLRWAQDAAAAGADALSIGVECTSWSDRFGNVWTSLIQEIRSIFPGLLTYSANWDEVDQVIFWDQLDFVGINAFYPLTRGKYRESARSRVAPLRELASILGMPVVFMEVGFTTRPRAAEEPWLWPDDMEAVEVDEQEQVRAFDAMFAAFLPEPWFSGFFVWRYYSNLDDVSQEAVWGFSPHGKAAEALLHTTFSSRFGADPSILERASPLQSPNQLAASSVRVPWRTSK